MISRQHSLLTIICVTFLQTIQLILTLRMYFIKLFRSPPLKIIFLKGLFEDGAFRDTWQADSIACGWTRCCPLLHQSQPGLGHNCEDAKLAFHVSSFCFPSWPLCLQGTLHSSLSYQSYFQKSSGYSTLLIAISPKELPPSRDICFNFNWAKP